MSHQSLVSVVIPSYNHEKFIGEAIESVLHQTHQEFEIIIIDDGSTDSTSEVLSRYESDPRLKIFYQENQGAAFAINKGLEKASGDYVAILNSDDSYHPERLETLIKVHDTHAEDDVVLYTGISFIDQDSQAIAESDRTEFYAGWLSFFKKHAPKNHFIHGNLLTTTSNLFLSKKTFLKVGDFVNLRYCHDWEWIVRASQVAKVIFAEQELVSYRVHDQNTILEQNLLRHSLENAYVFSSLVLSRQSHEKKVDELLAEATLFTKSRYFYSFMIVVVLYLRNCKGSVKTLELIESGELSNYFDKILVELEKSKAAFFSIKHVEEVISALNNNIENNKEEIRKGHNEIFRLQKRLNTLSEKSTKLTQENNRLTEERTKQNLVNRIQIQQISQLEENEALKERYLQLIEKSLTFRCSVYFEHLSRKLTNWRKMLLRFSLLKSNLISSNFSSNARYLYHIDWPEFDSANRYTFDGQERILTVSGWIVDIQNNRPLDNVVISTDGVGQTAQPTLLRPAVAEFFRSKRLAYCGFRFDIKIASKKNIIPIRVGFTKNGKKMFSDEYFEILLKP